MYASIMAESVLNISFERMSGNSIMEATMGTMFFQSNCTNVFHILLSISAKVDTIIKAMSM